MTTNLILNISIVERFCKDCKEPAPKLSYVRGHFRVVNGKKVYAENNFDKIALSVVKKGKQGSLAPENYVDGVTGATLTCDGVNKMIQDGLALYMDILKSLKK